MSDKIASIKAATQDFLEIEDIKDNLVLMPNGTCVLIIETTAVNFGLLSEKEQEALIFAYSGMLNSLSFPIQIYLRSKHKDISGYLRQLEIAQNRQTNPVLAERIRNYREFITTTVKEKNVLDKKFYIVIPFSNLELGVKNVKGFFGNKSLPFPKDYILNQAQTTLIPKRDHLLRQLNRLGLKGMQLSTQKLIDLFHDIYNQESIYRPLNPNDNLVPIVSKKPW
jgi:hypothetical protein